jgi:hypothetical protein
MSNDPIGRGQQREEGGVRDAAEERVRGFVEATRESINSLEERIALQRRVDEHPWRTLGIALAAGYVVGGGLFSPLTGRLLGLGLRLGVRMAALPMIRQELYGLADAWRGQDRGVS